MRLRKQMVIVGICALTATTALAHPGVKDARVKTWMKSMGSIGNNTKILGNMSKGAAEFDAQEARRAAKAISRHAGQIPVLFESPATDPKSEALPAIWEEFDDFTTKASDLQRTAAEAANRIKTQSDLRVVMGQIGGACQSCHKEYRE